MKPLASKSSLAAAAILAACATTGGGSPPRLDHEQGAGAPRFEPMLVVPLPPLQPQAAAGRAVEALQARKTPIGDVLLTLFRDSDINLLIDPSVQATECTFDIKRSTIEEAFDALLRSQDLAYEWEGGFLRVRNVARETIHVDLMENGAGNSSQSSGSSSSSSSSTAATGTGAQQNGFWDEIESNLPTLLGQNASFVVNRTASTIHVEARPSGIARLREVVGATTRRANQQVSLEARILEVRLGDNYSLGVNWSLLPGLFNSNKTGLAGGGSVMQQAAASGGTALTFGILDGGDFSVFVDALEQQGQVRVLSSPRVSAMNNQSATISVTDQIPYITRDVIDDQGVARTEFGVEFAQAGVVLNVRPMIGEDSMISCSITPQVREQTGTVVTPDGLVVVPVISEREATTTVRVADGQAIALGGLRSTRKSETRQGIPFLMNVPWVGQLFSSTVQERTEVELMIVLVPRVLDDTWIAEEVGRGSHRLVQLRRGFQWNSISLEGCRPEDWSGGSLQGRAQAAVAPEARMPVAAPRALPADRGTTVTRKGLADHMLAGVDEQLARGDVTGALAVIERAMSLEPSRADAAVAAAVLLERRGERARARSLFDRALATNPGDVVGLTGRGVLELDDGSPYAARRYLERAHEIGKTSLTAANLGAALVSLGEHQAARDLLQPLAVDGAPPELFANLAFAQVSSGHPDEAKAMLAMALAAGVDARNPRIVALDRLVTEALQAAAAPKP
ncbi:MAG: tetratricopeptide repeat protein [Planctomycetes bacterium]|nr:tetratricopeptide repeat protein [Planctomycetota bacterium]